MFEGHGFDVIGFQVLTHAAAAEQVPAMICGHAIKPGAERPRIVVLTELGVKLQKNLRSGVLGVFPGRHGAAAEAKNRGREQPVQPSRVRFDVTSGYSPPYSSTHRQPAKLQPGWNPGGCEQPLWGASIRASDAIFGWLNYGRRVAGKQLREKRQAGNTAGRRAVLDFARFVGSGLIEGVRGEENP